MGRAINLTMTRGNRHTFLYLTPERQMISMSRIQSIRQLRRNGESIASIARKVGVSEPTVRKYLEAGDLSPKPPVRKRRASAIDEYVPAIEQWLAEDRETWHKQRHTATRVWERLRDEKGAEVSLSTVTRTVARLRREFAAERECILSNQGGRFEVVTFSWTP